MITSDALILTACVCVPIATCAVVRVCYEWLIRADENRTSQRFQNTEIYNTKVDVAQARTDAARARVGVELICKELGIDLDKKD